LGEKEEDIEGRREGCPEILGDEKILPPPTPPEEEKDEEELKGGRRGWCPMTFAVEVKGDEEEFMPPPPPPPPRVPDGC